MLPPQINTPRLRLRLPDPAQARTLHEMFDDDATVRHVGTARAWSHDVLLTRLAAAAADYREHGYALYTVSAAEGGTVMGLCGLSPDERHTPELCCVLGREHWRNGYCREAVGAVLAHARTDAGPSAITARMESDHPALPFMEREILRPHGFDLVGEAPHPHSNRPMRQYRWVRAAGKSGS